MLRCEKMGLVWYESELLTPYPRVRMYSTTRHGGGSHSPYDSLNLSFEVGDDPTSVQANREKVEKVLDIGPVVEAIQCHGTEIAKVERATAAPLEGFDALSTTTPGIPLMVKHADCQAALFYDPEVHAVTLVHAGWRGNVANLYARTVQYMAKHYGSVPQNILVAIGPSLGPKHSEFKNHGEELPKEWAQFEEVPDYFNLWAVAKQQMLDAGIAPQHIDVAELCTYTHSQDFFSYRRENVTGRHGTIAMLLP